MQYVFNYLIETGKYLTFDPKEGWKIYSTEYAIAQDDPLFTGSLDKLIEFVKYDDGTHRP